MWEAEAAGGKVPEVLLVNEDHIIDAETFQEKWTPIVKMLTRSVTKAEGNWRAER